MQGKSLVHLNIIDPEVLGCCTIHFVQGVFKFDAVTFAQWKGSILHIDPPKRYPMKELYFTTS